MSLNSPKSLSQILHAVSAVYDRCKLPGISKRHLQQLEMMGILGRLQSSYPGLFELTEVGKSTEGRSINLIKLGHGSIKILMWSQMHGDESTATRALLDMVNVIGSSRSEAFVGTILESVTLCLVPMVNPDGAERYQRRNAQDVDINRDAVALQTPEGRTLKIVRDELEPEFGFNLHDQDPRFAVGNTDQIAAIALLAPAYDEAKSTNEVRRRAIHLASFFADILSHVIPGHVSRYDDSYDPRAFGDRMQFWGTSTVLVESGGWLDDPEKEYLRKLNTIGLLSSCHAIATREFMKSDVSIYDSLPMNNKNVFDIIIRDASCDTSKSLPLTRVDIGINIEEQRDGETHEVKRVPKIVDIGDLTPFRSFRTIEAHGRQLSIQSLTIGSTLRLQDLETSRLFLE
jgi:hypothetical protein